MVKFALCFELPVIYQNLFKKPKAKNVLKIYNFALFCKLPSERKVKGIVLKNQFYVCFIEMNCLDFMT